MATVAPPLTTHHSPLTTFRFGIAIFVGAYLLMLVQPMCAKMVLPLLGGTPAVWNTCMVFFQAGLLGGYVYAHYIANRLGLRVQAAVHLVLLAAAGWLLPIALPESVPGGWPPVLWLLASLIYVVGLPFLLVSATAPLLQRWFAQGDPLTPGPSPPEGRGEQRRDPYFLYAASNLGSFAGLLSYPLLVEPQFTLPQQTWLWLGGYLALLVLIAFCFPWGITGPVTGLGSPSPKPSRRERPWLQRLRWVALALVPSSLMLSVTTYLTTDIAPVPLLWVIPLGLYLLTFAAAFASRPWVPRAVLVRWVPLAVLLVVVVLLLQASEPLPVVLGIHLLAMTWLALACHTELASCRPPTERLTEFYLCLAIGGVLGGMFNGLLAPLIFSRLTEYPLMLVLAALLCGLPGAGRPTTRDIVWVIVPGAIALAMIVIVQSPDFTMRFAMIFAVPLVLVYIGHGRVWRFAFGLGAVLLASALYHGIHGVPVYRARSYFGVHLVADGTDDIRRLVHGGTVHGMESRRPDEEGVPLTYYHRTGPIGRMMEALQGDPRLQRVGLIGLGAGSLAAYCDHGQRWTFYEIDPAVIRIARSPRLFTFLSSAPGGAIDIVQGDGRIKLQESNDTFGLLVIDAFGSDAIPVHLLTREALEVYRDHLQPHGIVALHISNNYLDLEPVLAKLADSATPPLRCYVREDLTPTPEEREAGKMPSVWAAIVAAADDLPEPLRGTWRPARARDDVGEWTDHYSNIWRVFRWRGARE